MKKTIKLSNAPGCIGSPTIRAMEHPLCGTCAFKDICHQLALRNRARLVEDMGQAAVLRPVDRKPAPQQMPRIRGKEISESTKAFMKELRAAGYERDTLERMIKEKGLGEYKGGRLYTWLGDAVAEICCGATVQDLRAVLTKHGIRGTLATSRAAQFIKVLVFYDLVEMKEGADCYAPVTQESA